ncbi:MAG: DMT family transporter [Firmicutes bacterium]|nr:DMT family transporter [Bacillota bacterium]
MSGKSSSRTISVAALVFTTTMWGLSFISTKVLLRRLAPIQVAFLRHAIASVAIWIAAAVARPNIRVSLRDLPTMLIAAVVGIPIYYYFENTGLLYLSAATASIITASTPAMTAVIESIFYRKRLPLAGWAGILVSAGGVALVVQSGAAQAAAASAAGRSDFLLGASMLLTSSFAWSLYTIFNRPNVASYGSLTTNAYQITFATAVLYVATLRNGVPWREALSRPEVLLNLGYLGIFCSAVGYLLYLFALQSLGPTVVSAFINLVPVFGVAGSALILGEQITLVQLVGGAIVVLGIFAVERMQGGTQ